MNWEALGKGASFTVPMVVDNTAPELLDVSLSLMGGNLTVQAKDNQYVAGVVLYNASGAKILAKTGAKQDIQPGEAAQYTLDLTGVTGKSFLLRVYDYALNATTYQVNLQNGGEDATPDVLAFQTGTRTWVGLDQADSKDLGELATSEQVYVAAAEVDGMIFAATEQGGLYVLDEADLSIETYVANMGVVLTDMAYYPATSTLYGVTGNRLVQVDKLTGAVTDLAEIPFPTSTLACDGDGTFTVPSTGTATRWRTVASYTPTPWRLCRGPATWTTTLMEVAAWTAAMCRPSWTMPPAHGRPLRRPKTETSMGTEL